MFDAEYVRKVIAHTKETMELASRLVNCLLASTGIHFGSLVITLHDEGWQIADNGTAYRGMPYIIASKLSFQDAIEKAYALYRN